MPYRFQFLMLICQLLLGCNCWAEDLYSIRGSVVHSVNGMGIGRALVRIQGTGEARQVSKEVFSDASGAFVVEGLAKGIYRLSAVKPQFTVEPGGNDRGIELKQNLENAVVRLVPLGVIEGQVKDGAGRPMRGVTIKAYERRLEKGRGRMVELRNKITDDLGMYRMWNLKAGKIYLKATGRAGGTLLYSSEQVPTFVSYESFSPVYHDGAEQAENASAIELGIGQQARADFRLRLEKAYRIRGVVRNLQPSVTAKFELLRGKEDVTPNRATLSVMSGAFEMHDVVAGSYRMRVTQGEGVQRVVAEEFIEVRSQDRAGLEMRAMGGVDIEVGLQFSGKEPEEVRLLDARMTRWCSVELTSMQDQRVHYMWSNSRGEGSLKAVLPGEYDVRANCNAAYVRGLMMGSEDVLSKQKLVVLPGMSGVKLEVQADWNGGRIEFDNDGFGAVALNNRVLIVPEFASAVGAHLHPGGVNEMATGMAPGDYTLYRMSNETFAYREPQEIRMLKNGVRVRVNAGETSRVSLKELAR